MKRISKRMILLRLMLAVLILCNMIAIYCFSAQNGEESDETSQHVTTVVAGVVVKDFEEKTPEEQEEIVGELHAPLRKLAHMLEFGCLGGLILLLLLTWEGKLLIKWMLSLAATLLYAVLDEWHQTFSEGRGPQIEDVLIDLLGAVFFSGIILLFAYLNRRSRMRTHITRYAVYREDARSSLKLAVVADLHGEPYAPHLNALRREAPDMILIPGDLMDDVGLLDEHASGYEFLRACAQIAPTYYSFGNHELACYHKGNPWRHPIPVFPSQEVRARISATGAILLDDEGVLNGDVRICGLTSGINGKHNHPNAEALKRFESASEFRILLCHHPEYYAPYVRKTGIELTVSGHAHGGQWRIFGRGVYAPGQGIFPKYTAGVIDGRCVISRGIANHTWIPRIFNPAELVVIYCGKRAMESDLPRKYLMNQKET